ncbi:hypothetical protein [Flavobacterium rivuli]|uniref:hypothetical protein n=1 Tax=Flavobacterium rivuli TaxID=498301 RepID=UPI00036D4EA1|nr:hypothetical protein [Flavobacterium rivuli]
MKKIGLYFLVIIIAAYNTGLYELAKLPAFFIHYTEHKEQQATINIKDFIVMHYLGHDLNDNDDKKDNQLPFKNYHAPSHPNLLFVPVQHNYTIPLAFAETIIDIPYQPVFAPETASSIYFRPPCCS